MPPLTNAETFEMPQEVEVLKERLKIVGYRLRGAPPPGPPVCLYSIVIASQVDTYLFFVRTIVILNF